jgi:hypothetical protein
MRKVDILRLILIDFYVPAFAPRLSSIEVSLQLSENTALLLPFRIYTSVIRKEILIDARCLGRMICLRVYIYIYIYIVQCGEENFNFDNLYRNPMCHVLLVAFLISMNTAAIGMLLLMLCGL